MGVRRNLISGNVICAKSEPWVSSLPGFKPNPSSVADGDCPTKWMNDSKEEWDPGKLRETFTENEAREIAKILIGPTVEPDTWVWNHSKDGSFLVKSSYKCLRTSDSRVARPDRHIYDDPGWKKLWSYKIPPKFSYFI
ncbi:hypothetical protein LINPERHAP2_LOCUS20687 [Linum perenne]